MPDKAIFLCANQPVIRSRGRYYTKLKNFIDFLAELAKQDDCYRLVVPCKVLSRAPGEEFTLIDLPDGVIEGSYYAEHWQAFLASFWNALRIRSDVLKALKKGKVTVVGPGPNSFLFWLSLFVPKSTKFAFFIRGDTLKTFLHIYGGTIFSPASAGLVKLFRRRIISLVKQKRASVFLYGERLKEQYQGLDSAIHVISPLIDASFVREGMRPLIAEGEPLKILYVGRLSKEKNVLSLIDACAMTSKGECEFTLSIIGFGPLETEIRKRIAGAGLGDKIAFLGYVPHGDRLMDEYDRHHVFCLPSYTEGVPRTVIEAFARGMPVIATPVGSLPSLFPEEIKFLDGLEAKHILGGIKWCQNHRSRLSEMGQMGQKGIYRFLIQENVNKVHEILHSFL